MEGEVIPGVGREISLLHTHFLHLQIYFGKQLGTSLCLGVALCHPLLLTSSLISLFSLHIHANVFSFGLFNPNFTHVF